MTGTRAERRLRLFVAVSVPARVRDRVAEAADEISPLALQARWTEPANWHLTLAFLGPVHPERVEAITTALTGVSSSIPPFDLTLDGTAGTFGQRVLWARFEPSEPLERLAREVQVALEPLGFPTENRPFHPHLTLARSRDGRLPRGIEERFRGPRLEWRVEDVALMRSELHRHGAHYSTERRFPLGEGA